jgi:Zn-dependent protease with chaperone function
MLAKRTPRYLGIDPKSWEHTADKAALSAVKELKGIDEIFKLILSLTSERAIKLLMLASSVKVTEKQYSNLDRIINDIVFTFDWPYKPTVFVSQSPVMNAGVLGVKEPFIILNNAVLKNCEEHEVKAILAHEMGHIMSGHSLYKTIIWILTNITLGVLPIPGIVVYGILLVLSEWDRKSELTADRVELLALQESSSSYNLLMRMAGAEDLSQVNINDFFLQAKEYDDQKSLIDSIHKILNSAWSSHPYPVVRLQELKAWEMSGYYQSIMDGNYLRREVYQADAKEEFKAAYEYYKNEFETTDDPLLKTANNLGHEFEKMAKKLEPSFNAIKGSFEKEFEKAAEGIKDKINDFLKPKSGE